MHSPTALFFTSLLVSVSALSASSGCGKSLPSNIKKGSTGSSNSISITSGGRTRTFLLHIPTNYSPSSARGLIFSFHGRGGSSSKQETLSGFSDPYFNKDLLAVYPQGLDNQFEGDPASSGVDDVQFTLDVLDYVRGRFCVDEQRVYASGKSNGGGLSLNVLACDAEASARFAAFSGCSGAYYQPNAPDGNCYPDTVSITCTPSRKVPLLEIHGSADTTIPFAGGARRGECLPSIDHFIKNWAYIDGLDSTSPIVTQLYNGNVRKYEYGGTGGLVTNYWVNGLTHSWASTLPNLDSGTPTYFNATSLLMDWFGKYSLS